MSTKVRLGHFLSDPKRDVTINVARLIETRALVQANSGAGKSWKLRKMLEQTHGHVQQIVLDMEGEFSTLREKFDYVLAGKGGDIPADPKTAEVLARKTLELGFSLIVDLYELKKPERIRFVRNFCDALVNAPKELWHSVLIVIDEAHVFVPEKGESEAASAIIDLVTRGRKRGFCTVLATQRLSKLNKDVAAELLNKFIGRTSLDIDRKRAGDELGFVGQKDNLALRNLKPGEFYAFGPAISDEVLLFKVGEVETTHPRAGQRLGHRTTRPTAHVKAVLKKLVNLPKEAEAELRDREQLRTRIRELERELRQVPRQAAREPDPALIESAYARGALEARRTLMAEIKLLRGYRDQVGKGVMALVQLDARLELKLNEVPRGPDRGSEPPPHAPARPPVRLVRSQPGPARTAAADPGTEGELKLNPTTRAVLKFLAQRAARTFTASQIAVKTGYSRRSSSFEGALRDLVRSDLVIKAGSQYGVVSADISKISELLGEQIGEEIADRPEDWLPKLDPTARKVLELLLAHQHEAFPREEIAERTGYSATSSSFEGALRELRHLGLAELAEDRRIRLSHDVREAA